MKKVLRVLVIALALLAIVVVPALAGGPPADKGWRRSRAGNGRGALKAPLYDTDDSDPGVTGYTCSGGADLSSLEQPGMFGFAVMNMDAERDLLIVQVSLKGGGNVSTYNVWVHQNESGNCYTPTFEGQLVTNGQGNGNAHVELPRTPGRTDFWVSLVDTASDNRYRTTSVQLY